MPASSAAWRHELAPWLAALEQRLEITTSALPTRKEMANLWLRFRMFFATDFEPARWTLILEALELLDLLVRVDTDSGWGLLFSITEQSATFAANEAALFPRHKMRPRYEFDSIDSFEMRTNVQTVFLALRRMIGEDDQPYEPPSPDFARDGRIEIKPRVTLTTRFQAQPVPFIVQHTRALAAASRTLLPLDQQIQSRVSVTDGSAASAEQLEIRRQRAVFCFVSLIFELGEYPVTSELLYRLLHMAMSELPITELVLDQVLLSQLRFSTAGSFFSHVLGARSCRGVGLQRFEFSSGLFDAPTVSVICSALALSQTITDFAFTQSPFRDALDETVDRSAWWPWLAYALFSLDAQHHIETVDFLGGDLTMQDVEAMRAVLAHPNPLAYVCALDEPEPKSPVLVTPPTTAIIKPRTRIAIGHHVLIAHEENFVDRGTATLRTSAPYQIVRDNTDEDFLEIVVPGSGVAWIDRADVQEIQPLIRRQQCTVKHLELNEFGEESRPAVLALLGLLGGSLETLHLFGVGEPLDDSFMDTVCARCPNLKRLCVEARLKSVNWLTSLASFEAPRCKLEHLALTASIADDQSLWRFFEALANGTIGLAHSLRGLHFQDAFTGERSEASFAALCQYWLAMLQKNSRLEACEFLTHDGYQELAAFKHRLRANNGKCICVPEKTAFLSVLTDSHRDVLNEAASNRQRTTPAHAPPSARFNMPRDIAELILEMADVPLRRICA